MEEKDKEKEFMLQRKRRRLTMSPDYSCTVLLYIVITITSIFSFYWLKLAQCQFSTLAINAVAVAVTIKCILASSLHSPYLAYDDINETGSTGLCGATYRQFLLRNKRTVNYWIYYAPYIVVPAYGVFYVTAMLYATTRLFYCNFEL